LDIDDKVSFGFGITIACLVAIPVVLLIGLITSLMYSTYLCGISLGLYIPSFILYLFGTLKNRAKLISVGYGLGLPSYILSFLTAISAFGEITYRISDWNSFIYSIMYIIITGSTGWIIPPSDPLVPIWVTVLVVVNIVSGIIAIIFGSIIFNRREHTDIDDLSQGFSIVIACLISLQMLILTINPILGLISLGLYIPSMILYLVVTGMNKNKLVYIAFGLGLSSWIINIFALAYPMELLYYGIITVQSLLSVFGMISTIICFIFGTIIFLRYFRK